MYQTVPSSASESNVSSMSGQGQQGFQYQGGQGHHQRPPGPPPGVESVVGLQNQINQLFMQLQNQEARHQAALTAATAGHDSAWKNLENILSKANEMPKKFSGKDQDWADWKFSTRTQLSGCSSKFGEWLDQAVHSEHPVSGTLSNAVEQR